MLEFSLDSFIYLKILVCKRLQYLSTKEVNLTLKFQKEMVGLAQNL